MWRGGGGEGVCGEAANFQSRNLLLLITGLPDCVCEPGHSTPHINIHIFSLIAIVNI